MKLRVAPFVVTAGVRSCFALLLCGTLLACREGSGGVTRMADGVRYEGRFVNPDAYAAYLLGMLREAQGNSPGALSAYREAQSADPDSPEVMARIGAVQCNARAPSDGPTGARAAFERGIRNDPEYFGCYLERARCTERAGALSAALGDATAAVARRPSDDGANLLVARLLEKLGRREEARAWLEAFRTFHAPSAAASQALDAARGRTGAAARRAKDAPARSAAFGELLGGHPERAQARAQTELDADPTNADAWVAALVACDALRDEVCFERVLGTLSTPGVPPSETALGYLRELVSRRAGANTTF